MSLLTDTLIEQLNILLASGSDITATELRAFEVQIVAAIGQLEVRARGSRIFTGELLGAQPDPSLGLEGDLYVSQDGKDWYSFMDGQWIFLFNGEGRAGTFAPIAANQYGTHPDFNTQRELDIWLLQHVGTGTVTPPAPAQLAAPANRQASATSDTALNVTASSVANATGYKLFRSATSGGTYTQIGGTLSQPSFADTGRAASTTYYYKWQAMGNGTTYTDSALSAAFSGTTQAPPVGNPAAPSSPQTNVTARYDRATLATGFNSLSDYEYTPTT